MIAFWSRSVLVLRTAKRVSLWLVPTSASTSVFPSREMPSAVPSNATSGIPYAPRIVAYRSTRPSLVRTMATVVVFAVGKAT